MLMGEVMDSRVRHAILLCDDIEGDVRVLHFLDERGDEDEAGFVGYFGHSGLVLVSGH